MYDKYMKDIFKQIALTMIKALSPKKSPETYNRNWWWVVYGKIVQGTNKLSKKTQDKEDEIKKTI